MMLNSLRMRLLLMMLGCILLAVGVTAVFASRATSSEFTQFVAQDFDRDQSAIAAIVEGQLQAGSLDETEAILETLSQAYQLPIALSDEAGNVIFSAVPSEGFYIESEMLTLPDAPFIYTESGGGVTLTVQEQIPVEGAIAQEEMIIEFAPLAPPISAEEAVALLDWSIPTELAVAGGTFVPNRLDTTQFLNSVQRWLLIAGGAAVLLTSIVSMGLSQRIVRPVEALTQAAQRMERGDLAQRVFVQRKDEIGALATAFNSMADGLATQERLRQQMVTDIAHELRTPLGNIRGYLEAIQDGMVQPETAVINSLHEESLLLQRLINDLQELSLAEAGQLPLHLEEIDVGELVAKTAVSMQPVAQAKAVLLSTELHEELPLLKADPMRLGQVLRNLVQNGLTHTPAGGEVRITAVADENELALTVSDTGAGIASDHLPHIFDRFYRTDAARARQSGGSGLGLAIVKALVTLHNGTIDAHSQPHQGTTFSIHLPV